MLSPQQVAHFDTFGFMLLRRLFSSHEITAIRGEADGIWDAERVRNELKPDERLAMAPFIERSPLLLHLPEDDRIFEPIEDLLGQGFLWSGSEGIAGEFRTHAHHWHSDRAGELEPDYRCVKAMMYLTPLSKDTGCLRVIPGSHRLPLYRDLHALQSQAANAGESAFGVAAQDLPSYPLETEPGDVIFFNHYLFHGVYGTSSIRRYIAMKFVSMPTRARHLVLLQRFADYVFEPEDVLVNSESPRLRGLVDHARDLGKRAKELASAD